MLELQLAYLVNALFFGGAFVWAFTNSDEDTATTGSTDTVTGGQEQVNGTPGDDSLSRADSTIANIFALDAGDDTAVGGSADDTIAGEAGDDSMDGALGNDSISGGTGADTILGNDGNDVLIGEIGDDSISGGANGDVLSGGDGNDTLWGDAEADRILGDAGDDLIDGGLGRDTLFGGLGADEIYGGRGEDTIYGYLNTASGPESGALDGADSLFGGVANDTLYLGAQDQGTGGNALDTFVIDGGIGASGAATITDYTQGSERILIEHEPGAQRDTLETRALEDGSGSEILFEGNVIAVVIGPTDLATNEIELVEI